MTAGKFIRLVEKRLLDHPFYRAWEQGKVSREILSVYARHYALLLEQIPGWWRKAGSVISANDFLRKARLESIVAEEENHILLWRRWQRTLPDPRDLPLETPREIQHFIQWVSTLSPSMVLGVLHAFELQQPEVSTTKRQGLCKWYGYTPGEDTLRYFEVHAQEEDAHISFAEEIGELYAWRAEFEKGIQEGSHWWYQTLDPFAWLMEEETCG